MTSEREIWVYKLRPRGVFHFGERGVGEEATEEHYHSDSLFSALCAALREVEGSAAVEEMLRAFQGPEPPFRLTSAFPYAGDVFLLPRPRLPLVDAPRELKKVRFVSWSLFWRWVTGRPIPVPSKELLLQDGQVWVAQEDMEKMPSTVNSERHPRRAAGPGSHYRVASMANPERSIWIGGMRAMAPRVTVDRITCHSAVYACGRVVFRQECGLYFLVEWIDEGFRPAVELALSVLGDNGIGGERSAGHGQFEPLPPRKMTVPESDGRKLGGWTVLSLYAPDEQELRDGILHHPAAYDLDNRFGWIYSPDTRGRRRREVRMIVEGSVLADIGRSPHGRLVDVTPENFHAHKVYRYGLAFPVPISVEVIHAQADKLGKYV